MSYENNDLIWSMDKVRKLFQTYRIWPSFVGPKLVIYQEERNTLPVKLWKEQKRYINETMCDSNSSINIENHIALDGNITNDLREKVTSSKRTLFEIDDDIDNKLNTKKQKITTEDITSNHNQSITYSFWTEINNMIMFDNPIAKLLWQNKSYKINTPHNNENNHIINDKQNIVEYSNNFNDSNISYNTNKNNDSNLIDEGNKILDGAHSKLSLNNNIRDSVVNDENRFQVFKCLMNQSYFIGNADVYGGDYGLYKDGDPTNAHATATVRIVDGYKISVKEFLAFSRVQNQVAKSAVLGFKNPSISNVSNENNITITNNNTITTNFSSDDNNNNNNNTNNTEEPIIPLSKNSSTITIPEICFITFNFRNVSDRIS